MLDDDRRKAVTTVRYLAHSETLKHRPCRSHGVNVTMPSPDLSIVLSDAELRFPLVAEAKILDAAMSKTVALYCKAGIRRFVDGEYAWGNRESFMIGYVRDGSSINKALTPFLSKTVRRYRVQSLPVPVRTSPSNLAHTRHGRDFVYPSQRPPNSPGPISLWDLWLA